MLRAEHLIFRLTIELILLLWLFSILIFEITAANGG